jgi:hypothetical protein
LKTLVIFIFAHNYPSLKVFEKFSFQNWGHLPKMADLDSIERDLILLRKRFNYYGAASWKTKFIINKFIINKLKYPKSRISQRHETQKLNFYYRNPL